MLNADHAKALLIANAVAKMKAFLVDSESVHTNIVLIELNLENIPATANITPTKVVEMLREKNVLILPFGPNNMRLVTHRDITDEHAVAVITAFEEVSSAICE